MPPPLSTPEAASGPPPGMRVGSYELLARLGEGGMGVVHLARRPDGHRLALKVLRPHIIGDDEARHRLAREVSSLSRIRSRYVAEIVDADPWGPIPYVATRYVPGPSLHDAVRAEGPVEGIAWFAARLAEGVASVHAVGVLHRDVKPSNVLLEGRMPILIDFGLARVADDPRLTHTGWLLGTPGYLAPEILYGENATTASDVHAWAATVAYAGLGAPPFGRGPAMAVMDRVRRGQHDLTALPDDVRGVVEAALDPHPGARPTLPEVLRELLAPRPADDPVALPPPGEYTQPLVRLGPPAVASTGTAETRVEGPEGVDLAKRSSDGAGPATDTDEPPTHRVADADDLRTAGRPVAPLAQPQVPLPAEQPRSWTYEEPTSHERSQEWSRTPERESPWPAEWEQQDDAPGMTRGHWLRAIALDAGLVGVAALAVAYAPYAALAALFMLVWLLRAGSLSHEALSARRMVRGHRWHDRVGVSLGYPWYLAIALPGLLLMMLIGGSLGVAAGLLGYAASGTLAAALPPGAAALVAGVVWGPGGSRFAGPVRALTRRLSASPWHWAVAAGVVVIVLSTLAGLVSGGGVTWEPGTAPPWR